MATKDFLTSGEAARLLGVSEATVQRWDAKGPLPARRHPTSNRRLYPTEAVHALKIELERAVAP